MNSRKVIVPVEVEITWEKGGEEVGDALSLRASKELRIYIIGCSADRVLYSLRKVSDA